MNHLTNQENRCLKWAAAGKTSAEIGLILSISQRTVDFHINNVCTKLGVNNRQTAVAMALQHGLIPDILNLIPNLPGDVTTA